MTAKVCPRCGAQYENLKSKTCPQCFAVLVPVDEAMAEELTAARREVEQTPEFQQVKAADDERFRQQSFGACLGVVGITLATLVLVIVLIVAAAHRRSQPRPTVRLAPVPALPAPDPLTTLPVAAATLGDVLPPEIGPYRQISQDQNVVLAGTLTPLFHGVYTRPGLAPLDVYALPAGRPTSEQNQFRLGLSLASQVGLRGGKPRPLLFFATEYWHFATLAAPGQDAAPAEFRDALAQKFRAP